MHFPVKLYHKDHDVYVASGYPTYPIVVQSQDEYDGLARGWCADPVKAASWDPTKDDEDLDDDIERDDTDAMLDEEGGKKKKKKK